MQAVKETAANLAASALSGMEKTKAMLEEKLEKISTSDPIEKDMATLRKEDRISFAEIRKQEAYNQNAAAAAATGAPGSPTFTAAGQPKNPFHNTTAVDNNNMNKPVAGSTATVQPTNAISS